MKKTTIYIPIRKKDQLHLYFRSFNTLCLQQQKNDIGSYEYISCEKKIRFLHSIIINAIHREQKKPWHFVKRNRKDVVIILLIAVNCLALIWSILKLK